MARKTLRDQRGYVVTFEDSPEVHKRVFDALLAWYQSESSYDGESLHQSDGPWETAVPMLCEVAEEVFKFDVQSVEEE